MKNKKSTQKIFKIHRGRVFLVFFIRNFLQYWFWTPIMILSYYYYGNTPSICKPMCTSNNEIKNILPNIKLEIRIY